MGNKFSKSPIFMNNLNHGAIITPKIVPYEMSQIYKSFSSFEVRKYLCFDLCDSYNNSVLMYCIESPYLTEDQLCEIAAHTDISKESFLGSALTIAVYYQKCKLISYLLSTGKVNVDFDPKSIPVPENCRRVDNIAFLRNPAIVIAYNYLQYPIIEMLVPYSKLAAKIHDETNFIHDLITCTGIEAVSKKMNVPFHDCHILSVK